MWRDQGGVGWKAGDVAGALQHVRFGGGLQQARPVPAGACKNLLTTQIALTIKS